MDGAFPEPQKRPTPNARLLYVVLAAPGLEWQGAAGELQLYIESTPRLQRANPDTYLYFFASASSPEFLQEGAWVGMEVVGTPALEEDGLVKSMDLDAGSCLCATLEVGSFRDLFEAEEGLRQAWEQAGHGPLAETWRLRFSPELGTGRAQLQFFK